MLMHARTSNNFYIYLTFTIRDCDKNNNDDDNPPPGSDNDGSIWDDVKTEWMDLDERLTTAEDKISDCLRVCNGNNNEGVGEEYDEKL